LYCRIIYINVSMVLYFTPQGLMAKRRKY